MKAPNFFLLVSKRYASTVKETVIVAKPGQKHTEWREMEKMHMNLVEIEWKRE